jgi:hypothetical protein
MTDCRAIAKFNSRKTTRLALKPKLYPRKRFLAFLFEEINAVKRQLKPEKPESVKKRKAESILSTTIAIYDLF